jgi:hypothetical protein
MIRSLQLKECLTIFLFRSGKNHPLIPTNYKLTNIITELFERKEDCAKLKEKVARLEVVFFFSIYDF